MRQEKRNLFILLLSVVLIVIIGLAIGITFRNKMIVNKQSNEINKETIEVQTNTNSVMNYETNDITITKNEDRLINNTKTQLYNVNLSNIGLNFLLPQIALKENFNKVNAFSEIKIEKESDFENNYIMINENSFSSLIPSTYFIIARTLELNEEQLNLKNDELIESIFKNSFVSIEDEIETKTIDNAKILKYNIKMNPFGDIENTNNYSGKLIAYISNNKVKILICGVSTFSYESEAKLSLCEYVIESSSANF